MSQQRKPPRRLQNYINNDVENDDVHGDNNDDESEQVVHDVSNTATNN